MDACEDSVTIPSPAPTRPVWNTGTAMDAAPRRTSSAVIAYPCSRIWTSSSASRAGLVWVCGVDCSSWRPRYASRSQSSSNARITLPTAVECMGSRPPTREARGTRLVP